MDSDINPADFFKACIENETDSCPDRLSDCFSRELSTCEGQVYSDRYDDASAVWVMVSAILMFFMKAGFLFLESSFISSESIYVRRVVFAKYIDIFAGTLGFWFFGYALSGNTDAFVLGEDQDYIFWFFRFTFATNTATIIGGTLVGHRVQMTGIAIFVYSFLMTAFIHPFLARLFWSSHSRAQFSTWSPYDYCNGTFTANRAHSFKYIFPNQNIGQFTFIDFAGSGLVHICGGIGGLILAIFHKLEIKNCKKYICCQHQKPVRANGTHVNLNEQDADQMIGDTPDTPNESKGMSGFVKWMYPLGGGTENVQNAALGVLILWTTWFAFNAGSTETIAHKRNHVAVGRIALTMCLSCATAGLIQAIISSTIQTCRGERHANTNEIANAVLGGLVAVTGCCPFIDPPYALLIGAVSVLFYYIGCVIEYILKVHDGARVFPLHAMCGLWGVLCVGIFSRNCLIRELYENLCFCLFSELPYYLQTGKNWILLLYQIAGAVIIVMWSATTCLVIFSLLWFIPGCSFKRICKCNCKTTTSSLFILLDEGDPMMNTSMQLSQNSTKIKGSDQDTSDDA